jgi:hypothetical protein
MKLWIVLHTHRHGVDVYPLFQTDAPTEDEMVAATGDSYEGDRDDEFLEVNGPHEIPAEVRP